MPTVQLSNPLDADDADALGFPESRPYVLNETVAVTTAVAASLIASGYARWPDGSVPPAVEEPVKLLAGLTGPTVSSGALVSAMTADLSALITSVAGSGGTGGADTVHVSGLAGDGVTDDGPTIQAVLDTLPVTGTHSTEVFVEKPPTGVVYLNSTVQVDSDNTILRFGCPIVAGPLGRIRIQGDTVETPTSGKPRLTVDALTGATTLTVNDVSPFIVGSYIVLRGGRDATGNVYKDQKEYHTVTAITGLVLTLNEPLDSDFLAFNANVGSPTGTTHYSEVTRVVSTKLTVAAARGDRTITVADSSVVAAGDYIQVLDDTHTVTSAGTVETSNYKHREIAQVKQIVSSTQIRVSHSLHHDYATTASARVVKLAPVKGSQIRDAHVTWSAMSTVSNAFEINTAVACKITGCRVAGDGAKTKSWKAQAFRQTSSIFCVVEDCHATDPAVTDSGSGYGATLYGTTYCQIRGCTFSALRHSVLLFNGAAGNLVTNCVSEDCCLSDYDLHGADCVDNLITASAAIGGDSAATDGSVNKSACKAGNTTHVDGDRYNVFSNMLIVNYRGAAFEVVPACTNITFRDSVVLGALTGIKLVSNSGNTALATTDTFVENVSFQDVTALTNINGNSATSMVRGLHLDRATFVRATTGLVFSYGQRVRVRRCVWLDSSPAAGTYAITGTTVTGLQVKQSDWSGFARGVKLSGCPSARVTGNTVHDLTETVVVEDVGGNTSLLYRGNDHAGFTPTTTTSGTGPSTGGRIDTAEPYTADTPARHGWLEWNYDPILAGSGTGLATTSQTLYLVKFTPQTGGTVSNIVMTVGSGAITGTLTSAQNLLGIYDSTGTLIAQTADQTSAWATSGLKVMGLAVAVALQAGRDYYLAVLSNGSSGTGALFVRSNAGAVTTPNGGQANAALRFATNGTTRTALPSTLTLSSNSGSGSQPWWAALS